jgi:hypothetical protein
MAGGWARDGAVEEQFEAFKVRPGFNRRGSKDGQLK